MENLNLSNNFRSEEDLVCIHCVKLYGHSSALWQQTLLAYFISFSAFTAGSMRAEMHSRQDTPRMNSDLSETLS